MGETLTGELGALLSDLLEAPVEVKSADLLPGGASKEVWTVDVGTQTGEQFGLLVFRQPGASIYSETFPLEQEYRVQQAAYESGIKVARPYGYLEDLGGYEAFVTERLEGEDSGPEVVRKPEFAAVRAELPRRLAEELARIHAIPHERLPSLPGAGEEPAAPCVLDALEGELDGLEEPHPAVKLALRWLREHPPESHGLSRWAGSDAPWRSCGPRRVSPAATPSSPMRPATP